MELENQLLSSYCYVWVILNVAAVPDQQGNEAESPTFLQSSVDLTMKGKGLFLYPFPH